MVRSRVTVGHGTRELRWELRNRGTGVDKDEDSHNDSRAVLKDRGPRQKPVHEDNDNSAQCTNL